MQQLDISKLSTEQLKSLAYDEMIRFEISQTNLRALNQEIAKRTNSNESQQPPVEDTEVVQGGFE